MWSYLKFLFTRRLRRWRREFRAFKAWSTDYFNRHIWGKWRQLGIIRRLVVVWWGAIILMSVGLLAQTGGLRPFYLESKPLPGGTFTEGEVGQVKIVNPVLPEGSASADVTRLVFSGLTRYNPARGIEPDLATSWTLSPDGRTYTFNLRHDARWHDGVPFTARDVAFTVTAIQNPDTRSPLAASWLGVKAEAKDDYTVVFTLPSPYAPFIYSTTVGLLPSHSLESSDPSALRVAPFNQRPIGTGPFKLKAIIASQAEIQLEPNRDYYGGRPNLDHFTFRLYDSYAHLVDAYAKRQVTAIARYLPSDPGSRRELAKLQLHPMSLPDEVVAFLRTTSPQLSDAKVRAALALATDRRELVARGEGGNGIPLSSPLLPGQVGYDPSLRQPGLDAAAAGQSLDDAGWAMGASGVRSKDGHELRLKLVTSSGGNYPRQAELLKAQWAKVGVAVDITTTDVSNLQQSYIRPRNYDVLLYGINIGADPDVYVYWHSSQAADPGLNLSQYASSVSDKALESGRLNSDSDIRKGKYKSFLTAWMGDTPAVVLYNPDYIYATNSDVHGVVAAKLNDPTDRFTGVEHWTVRTHLVLRGN